LYLGNFILYQNELEPIKVLKLNQSKQLIDIIQYLYDCHIIHRNLEPENLMLDNCRQQLKLIDFNYAKIYKINEMTKPLSIEGSITFAGHQFLRFISHLSSFDSLSSSIYYYETSFDLKSALNIIIYMNDNMIQHDMKSIINIKYFQEKALKLLKLWENVGKNKTYSNILYLIDNFNRLSTFDIIKIQLETFLYS
jgi:serine/threonine protein kinase